MVPLSGDEARRAQFVWAAKANVPQRLSAIRAGSSMELGLPVMLPAAEYRWLAAMGEMLNAPRRVRFDETTFSAARVMLGERLGVVIEVAS
jgi:hypothetical protein